MKDIFYFIVLLLAIVFIIAGMYTSERERQIQEAKLQAWLQECSKSGGHVQQIVTELFDSSGQTHVSYLCNKK